MTWREPVGLILGVGVPVLLLVIFGLSSGFEQRIVSSSPTTLRTAYVPILISLVLVLIALISLPIPIVVQRETQFLRRLSTTPIPPRWLLAAQVVVNLLLAVLAIVLIVVGAALFFGVDPPLDVPGFVLAVLLAAFALFSIGLLVAALAPSQGVAGAIGSFLVFPLMFFAGLWTPRQTIPSGSVMHQISNLSPLGAAVQAMLGSIVGRFPSLGELAVMTVWAAVCGAAAVKLFRWE